MSSSSGTFQPLRHRSGTMRDRLHAYTKRTLGAGGSINEAVRANYIATIVDHWLTIPFSRNDSHYPLGCLASWRILCWMGSCSRH
jgi:hypothetical protein